ncbi:hypothetical protein FDW83_14430 [Pseudarthrobacter sp. NamE2]|uniref:SRPBCC family protein n=1 Tax=Pseudarthrobacter sp. NamE2 TaxID=2576838 RepID=UPI0010FE2CBC|nr:SRPBCC family protein [Pseudarthrobacter sp. NamE2]TLM81928.1 hypothetical protein FDW83_14430 [Pseudarthrobacter sp. NamE2]
MKPISVSARFHQTPEAVWDFIFGDGLQRVAAASKMVERIEDYELRSDGTPRYTMVMKAGPLRLRSVSDYLVYERPRRSVNSVIGGLFDGGTAYIDLHPEGLGTRADMHIELAPRNLPKRLVMMLLRPLLVPMLAADFRRWVPAAEQYRRSKD